MGERRLDLFGGRGANDDRPPRLVSGVQFLGARDRVQDERIVQVELALDGDLRHAAAGRSEPALPHSSSDPPGSRTTISTSCTSAFSSSGVEPEWNAFTTVNVAPAASTVPPLFGPGRSSACAPFCVSHPFSSTSATIGNGPNFLDRSIVEPT